MAAPLQPPEWYQLSHADFAEDAEYAHAGLCWPSGWDTRVYDATNFRDFCDFCVNYLNNRVFVWNRVDDLCQQNLDANIDGFCTTLRPCGLRGDLNYLTQNSQNTRKFIREISEIRGQKETAVSYYD